MSFLQLLKKCLRAWPPNTCNIWNDVEWFDPNPNKNIHSDPTDDPDRFS